MQHALLRTNPGSLSEIVALSSELNAACQYDEADALVWEFYRARNFLPAALLHLLKLARDRGDWFGIIGRAADIRERLPENPFGYVKGIEAHRTLMQLDSAEVLLGEAKSRFSNSLLLLTEEAYLAEMRGDWKTVDARMASLRSAEASNPEVWDLSLQFLTSGGRYSEAQLLAEQALTRFPQNRQIHKRRAIILEKQHNWEEADKLWAEIVTKFPSDANLALSHATLWGRCLRRLINWPKTLDRLDGFHTAFPDYTAGYEIHVRFLRNLGCVQEAIKLAQCASTRFPTDPGTAVSYAHALQLDGRSTEAIKFLSDAETRMPFSPLIPVERGNFLAEIGLFDQAEPICQEACKRFRYNPRPFLSYAGIAQKSGALVECLARWVDGAKRFPQHAVFQAGVAAAHFSVASREDGPHDETLYDNVGQNEAKTFRKFLLNFESLGGPDLGCEFGLVQKKAGVESLGLLRWGEISIANLRSALLEGFAGLGSETQTDITFHEDVGDYTITDQRYSIKMHSFVKDNSIPYDKIFSDTCIRLSFLKKKLLRDLETSTKIFVFRLGNFVSNYDLIFDLHDAFRQISRSPLLCVAYAEVESNKSGKVEQLRPGLLLGYIEPLPVWEVINFSRWHQVCHAAQDLINQTTE